MALTNAERQARWRKNHKGLTMPALKARVAELEAGLAAAPAADPHAGMKVNSKGQEVTSFDRLMAAHAAQCKAEAERPVGLQPWQWEVGTEAATAFREALAECLMEIMIVAGSPRFNVAAQKARKAFDAKQEAEGNGPIPLGVLLGSGPTPRKRRKRNA
jgi:hypothetical protein